LASAIAPLLSTTVNGAPFPPTFITCALALAGNAEEPRFPAARRLFARLWTYMPKKWICQGGERKKELRHTYRNLK
jgi:hypothetical protein